MRVWRLGLLVIAGCASPQPCPHVRYTLRIENPERCSLVLCGVWDNSLAKREEFNKTQIERILDPGAYALVVFSKSGEAWYPAPLFNNHLRIRVQAPPPPEKGWSYIPSGPALIGDNLGVGQEDERPARIAEVGAFWISCTETTNAQYAAFLNAAGRFDPAWINLDSHKCLIKKGDAGFATTAPRMPVVTVSWHGAKAYCEWLSTTAGRRHRLPTEVEWEKAARGPSSFIYSYGNTYRTRASNQESGGLMDVGTFSPNTYGICDMTGNAFEWVEDAYDPAGEYRVLRGGSFVLDGIYLRNSFRMRYRPTVQADDIGFRVVKEVTP